MTRPNVLLITVDSLRADHVSACDPDAPVKTPNIDRIGHSGTTYTDAVAQGPFTTFSMPSLFTSRYPTGLTYVELSEDVVGVYPPADAETLTERLAEVGYATGGFHSNPLLSNLFDFDRGFDEFDADLPFADIELPDRLKLLTNKLRRLLRTHPYLPAKMITDRAIDWIRSRDEDRPFFCWIHYMDVHGPYQRKTGFTYYNKYRAERLWQKAVGNPDDMTPEEHDELHETYATEIAYTDEQVGRLLDAVSDTTNRPTVEVLTADHGEGFAEHGYYSHPHEVDDELVHVPLLVEDPTRTVEPGPITTPTELVDVAPTVLKAADASQPASFEGVPLGSNPGDESVAIAEAELVPALRMALRTSDWTYVVDDVRDDRYLVDRGTGDIVDEAAVPDRYDELVDIADAHRNRPAASETGTASHEIDDEDVQERLRQLGYVD